MCLEYIETDAHERKYVRHAIKEALAQPQETDWRAAYKEAVRQHSLTLDELREALAQPAACCECGKKKSDGWAVYCVDCIGEMDTATAQQEPVAWGYRNDAGAIYDCISPEAHADEEGDYDVPLYTAPQTRPWAGLTDEERRVCTQSPFTDENYRDIEAKLKEKNT